VPFQDCGALAFVWERAVRDVQTEEIIPDAVSLMESMRAVGYSVEAAVADLIDNSIAAEATCIEIKYDASGRPFLAVLDDGKGMTEDELKIAMRHGSRSPNQARGSTDLGRFGLGLKTASLSQCRRLTVITKKAAKVTARRWDLDVVRDRKNWVVVIPSPSEFEDAPLYSKLQAQPSGTLVLWEDLDRLVAGASDPQREMTLKLEPLYSHLALVFHRFIAGDDVAAKIVVRLNGLPVPSRDPFLRGNSFRQVLEGQVIRHERGDVEVTPYVLPPISRLSPDEIELAGGGDGLRGTQGFYVYRNFRLVIWGTWFRLVPKSEFYKLTRVKVDIPNTFDDLWALDIKKSAAFPPEPIRRRLQELIPHFANASRVTVTYPGKRSAGAAKNPLWIRIEPTPATFRYEIDADHVAVQGLAARLDLTQQRQFQSFLSLVSDLVPYESIYADMCADTRRGSSEFDFVRLLELARNLRGLANVEINRVLEIDPIAQYPQFHQRIRQELT
jgi:hypothetical protein